MLYCDEGVTRLIDFQIGKCSYLMEQHKRKGKAQSSAEAEFVDAREATKEVVVITHS